MDISVIGRGAAQGGPNGHWHFKISKAKCGRAVLICKYKHDCSYRQIMDISMIRIGTIQDWIRVIGISRF